MDKDIPWACLTLALGNMPHPSSDTRCLIVTGWGRINLSGMATQVWASIYMHMLHSIVMNLLYISRLMQFLNHLTLMRACIYVIVDGSFL
jgi:hypothetical protein